MFGFWSSFVLASICSFFLVSIFKPRNFLTGFLYIVLTTFAQIILAAEILSLIHQFAPYQFIGVQAIVLAITTKIWISKGCPAFTLTPLETFRRIFLNIKKDKALAVLAIGWIFSLLVALFLALVINITRSGDAEIYHVARSYFWVINQSINHFETSQVRMLAFPINSEILYAWVILFFKKATCIGLFSFIAFITAISALFGIMNNFSIRRRLWVIFIISAFANIIVQMSGTETDIIVAALVLSSMYLFKEGLKTKSPLPIFYSALSYALAIGTKTTAFFLIPAVGLFFLYHSKKILNQNWHKPCAVFIGFGVLNFIIFSAYNYVANFISFGNIIGAANTIEFHRNSEGLKGTLHNFIKTFFLMFDFTGFPKSAILVQSVNTLQDNILNSLSLTNLQNGLNSTKDTILSKTMLDTLMGTGILGGVLFIPCLLWAFIKPLFIRNKNCKENLLYATMFVITIVTLSASIVFMTFNNRFITTFVLVSAPILGYSYFYKRFGIIKWIITLIAIFYFTVISTHIWTRPFVKIIDALFVKHQTIEKINNRVTWFLYDRNVDFVTGEQQVLNVISEAPSHFKIVFFQPYDSTKCRTLEAILSGKNIEIKNLELFNQKNLLNYDIIIYPINGQVSNVSFKQELIKNCIYEDRNLNVITDPTTPRCDCRCFIEDEYLQILFNNGYRSLLPPDAKNDNTRYLILAKVAQK